MSLSGNGKKHAVYYCWDKEKDEVVDIIINSAKSGQYGHYGDGKILFRYQ